MTETSLSKNELRFLSALLLGILILVGSDLAFDYKAGTDGAHLLVELALALAAAIGFVLLVRDSFKKERALKKSRLQILDKDKEAEKWRLKSLGYIQGLSIAIDNQLEAWKLTLSEKEVALLLLKGLSLKEIADIRQTTEKTARAQSGVIYAKSGLAGRSELSAFFLEDLLRPPPPIIETR